MVRKYVERKQWRKKAVSPVIGNLIMVSITLALGLAFWTNVNSQAGATLQSKDRFLEVDSDSMFQALSFYVEEAAVRSNESFEPSEILKKIRMA